MRKILGRCASIAKEAMKHGIKSKIPFNVTPGSEQIRATIERDGISKTLTEFGGTVSFDRCQYGWSHSYHCFVGIG